MILIFQPYSATIIYTNPLCVLHLFGDKQKHSRNKYVGKCVIEMNNKQDAIKEFEHILTTYVLPLIPACGSFEFREIREPISFNKLIILRKHSYFTIYPCLENPQFSYRICSAEKCPQLGPALSVLTELMRITQYRFNHPAFPKTPYYDLGIH